MRPIKFRAFDKTHRVMHHFAEMSFCQEYGTLSFESVEHPGIAQITEYDYSSWEIMQFTSLLDKNGKEIYEGDILRIYYLKYPDQNAPIDRIVVFEPLPVYCGFALKSKDGAYQEALGTVMKDIDDEYTVEVIGNIYETGK